eukprot:2124683-Prymnesium_polylepis.1
MLADEMGLGKTVQSVSTLNHIWKEVRGEGAGCPSHSSRRWHSAIPSRCCSSSSTTRCYAVTRGLPSDPAAAAAALPPAAMLRAR